MFTPLLPRGKIRSKVSVLFIQNKKARHVPAVWDNVGRVLCGREEGREPGEKIRAGSRVQCRHLKSLELERETRSSDQGLHHHLCYLV